MEYTDDFGNRVNVDIKTELGIFTHGAVIKGVASYSVSVGNCLKVVDVKFDCTYMSSSRDFELTPSFCIHPVALSGFTAPYAMDAIAECQKEASAAFKRLLDTDMQQKFKDRIRIPLSHVRFDSGLAKCCLAEKIKSHVDNILFSAVEGDSA